MDLAPTLVRAAGLQGGEMPLCPEEDPASLDFCTEGQDLTPLFTTGEEKEEEVEEEEEEEVDWKTATFSQVSRKVHVSFSTSHHVSWVEKPVKIRVFAGYFYALSYFYSSYCYSSN